MDESFRTDRGSYTPHDLLLWHKNDMLVITPKFQRRSVWKTPARTFFIDTMLRGMMVPPIYLRLIQNPGKTKAIREVVDGQQRVRTVLEFIEGDFKLSRSLKAPWAGKKFSDLSSANQEQLMTFSFSAETFKGISDQQVFEVFSRLNTYTVPLNKQELRNGKFFGLFKQASYALAISYLEFWRHHRIFTEVNLARMLEVELTSELLIAGMSGMQDKKASIDDFYSQLDEEYPTESKDERHFREVMETISDCFNGDLADSQFRRAPLFYSLYCVVFHHMFGLPGMQRQSPKRKLSTDQRESLKQAVINLSEVITTAKDPAGKTARKYQAFVTACQRQTDNITPRKKRFDTLFDEAF